MRAIGVVEYIGDMELGESAGYAGIAVRVIAGCLDTEVLLQTANGSPKFWVERLPVVNAPEGYAEGACLAMVRKFDGTKAPEAGTHLDVVSAERPAAGS